MKLRCLLLSLAFTGFSFAATSALSNTGNTSETVAIGLSALRMMSMMPGPFGPMPGPDNISSSQAAVSFTTSSQPLTVDSLLLLVDSAFGPGSFSVSLHSNGVNAPDASLATFTPVVPGSMPTVGENLYTLSSGLVLQANTTYWIVTGLIPLASMSSASVGLEATTDLSESSADGHTIGTTIMRSAFNGSPGPWSTDATRAFQFAINPVPEPTSAVLIMLSGGLFLRRQRSRRAA